MMAGFTDAPGRRPAPPSTVKANIALAPVALLAGWLLTFHPLTLSIWGFFLFYLGTMALFAVARSALLRFLVTGFHLAAAGVTIAALLLLPEELRGDPFIPVRCALVISVSIAVTVLQWLPATSRWLDRS